MPSPSVEQLRKVESSLSGTLAERGDSMDPIERRRVRKRIRRAQRKRRRLTVEAAQKAAQVHSEQIVRSVQSGVLVVDAETHEILEQGAR